MRSKFDVLIVSDGDDVSELEAGLVSIGADQVKVLPIEQNILKALNEMPVDLMVLDVKKPLQNSLNSLAW